MKATRPIISLATLAVLVLSACGPNNENPNIITDTTTRPNNETNNNTNTSPNNTTNNATNSTNNGTVVDPNEGCVDVEEFSDQQVSVQREFRPSGELDAVSCEMDVGEIATSGTYIARLQYSVATDVTITVDGIAADTGSPPRPALEIRHAACADGAVEACATDREYSASLEANTPYYLIITGLLDSGGVALEIQADIPQCTAGETTCSEGIQSVCDNSGEFDDFVCPGGCMDERCGGDDCAAPLTVSPEPNGAAIVLEGNRQTFSSRWDAMGGTGCELEAGEPPAVSPWSEFWVLFEGITAGQTVILDAETSNDSYGFFVLDDCSATTCLAAGRFDSNDINRFTYTAAADGDVLVAVESMSDREDRDFTIEASVRE